MPVSRSSREAYRRIVASGLINSLKLEVYEFVMNHQDDPAYGGLISRRDVTEYFGDRDAGDSYCARLKELVAMGACRWAGLKCQGRGRVQGARTTDATALRRPEPPDRNRYYVQHTSLDLLLGPYKQVKQRQVAASLANRYGTARNIVLLAVSKATGQIVSRSGIRRVP